jgi:Zn-dependent M16 (insulinase) family peptidase
MSNPRISIFQQIEEVEREIGQRASVYPRLVAAGKMRESIANYHVERMKAVLRSLQWLSVNEQRIKEMLVSKRNKGE